MSETPTLAVARRAGLFRLTSGLEQTYVNDERFRRGNDTMAYFVNHHYRRHPRSIGWMLYLLRISLTSIRIFSAANHTFLTFQPM